MRKITAVELGVIKSNKLTEQEIKSLAPVWCIVCKRFYYLSKLTHWAFSSSIESGGWYCSWHTPEQVQEGKRNLLPPRYKE